MINILYLTNKKFDSGKTLNRVDINRTKRKTHFKSYDDV
ncbi:hypothetical protein EMIT0P12_10141 [Pseudomonas sp. IT-P12]